MEGKFMEILDDCHCFDVLSIEQGADWVKRTGNDI